MTLPLPSFFFPQLTNVRLETISEWLLDEFYATEEDLDRPTDNGYTRGCATFGRQRNRIISEVRSGRHSWLGLLNSSNDLVFTVGDVPCRFSNDDPANPSKDAVLVANRHQTSFLEFVIEGEPGRFCFIIDRGHDGAAEPRVVLLGFSPDGAVACRWESGTVRILRLADQQALAPSVEVSKPQVAPKRRDEGDAVAEAGR